jgi:outer membrane protein TolC
MMNLRTVAGSLAGAWLTALVVASPAAGQEVVGEREVGLVRQVSLGEALELARQYAPTLEQQESALEIARYTELTAWGAFLPDASLSYGYSNSSSPRLDATQQALTRTNYSAQLRGSVDIFQGLRRFSSLSGAKRGVEASAARYRQAQYQTAQAVKVAWYNAVASRELVRVEADRVERQEDQLSFVDQQLQLGRATRSDVLRSQVDLNNAKVALLNARNGERASTFTLAEAVGLTEPLAPVEGAELAAEGLALSREALLSRALAGAPELVSAQAEARAQEAAVSGARAAYLPSLSLSGGWAWSNSDFPPENRSWSLSLSGSLPLFDGFNRENQLYSARARLDQARAQERAAEIGVRKDVDAALSSIEAATASIGLAEQTVELSSEDLRVTQ